MRKSELLVILFAAMAATAFGQGQPGQGQDQADPAQDPPSRVARLNYASGTVSFRPGSVDEWTAATINYPLYNGDHLWADRGARTELHVGSTALRMGSETALAVLNLDDRLVQLSLTGGTLQVRLRELGEGESFEVDTPNAAVTLLRAGEYRFFVDADQNLSMVTVRSGDAEVIGGGRAFVVHARESGRFTGSDDNFTNQLDSAPLSDEFEFWCQDRDRREDQSQSVSHVSRETIGYEDLDANGSWSDVPDYGWVWAPRVNAGWAPYRDGRWAWVEPWGWTWIDAAPWGFAPFHYGRWANYRGGWVWVPGTRVVRPVYAPALVAFVGGPRAGVAFSIGGVNGVAWFPLGPHEVYHPGYRVSEAYVRHVNVTHVTNIYVTNVHYVNKNQGSVTVVTRDVFVGARPVRNAHMVVGAEEISRGRVFGYTANIAPERSSVVVRTQGNIAAPPARYQTRAVVVRQAPPPPPVSFAARREALQADPGRPLDRRAVESLRQNDNPRPAMYRQAPAVQGRPMTPQSQAPAIRDTPREIPRQAAPTRNDRPYQQVPDQPRRVQEQIAPRPADRVQTPQDQPRREPRVQEQVTPRPADRVQTPQDQPRREPRVQEQQSAPRTEQPRREPRAEPSQPRPQPHPERTERPAEKKADPKKVDEKKQ